jgi:NADH-quinone oxidoreductase subunit L
VALGLVLDPLGAIMAVMVSLVSLLIFIYSLGYMAKDENFTRFFCFLALFGAAMLGLVIANSLLLFFMCWELVGLASYLLIGFWFQKPSAAAAAKKAFIVTRIGDLGFCWGCSGSIPKRARCFFMTAGTAAWRRVGRRLGRATRRPRRFPC